MLTLSCEEHSRYARHLCLPEIGHDGQLKIKAASILCIGAGGLAASALAYLAAAGIGKITIIDDDKIELSNLQRQIMFTTEEVGQYKALCLRNRLLALNPHITINSILERFSQTNANSLITEHDIILDCSDNFYTRYLANDRCFQFNKPTIHASIQGFHAQCSVFGYTHQPCYRCLYPVPPINTIPNCNEAGVIGALPGILGAIQAIEALKLILNQGIPLLGRVLTLNAITMQFNEIKLGINPECSTHYQATHYQDPLSPTLSRCAMSQSLNLEISVSEAKKILQANQNAIFLDVRQASEYAERNLGARLIPLAELAQRYHELDTNHPIIIHCQAGGRSLKAAHLLNQLGFSEVYSVQGGILAWLQQ